MIEARGGEQKAEQSHAAHLQWGHQAVCCSCSSWGFHKWPYLIQSSKERWNPAIDIRCACCPESPEFTIQKISTLSHWPSGRAETSQAYSQSQLIVIINAIEAIHTQYPTQLSSEVFMTQSSYPHRGRACYSPSQEAPRQHWGKVETLPGRRYVNLFLTFERLISPHFWKTHFVVLFCFERRRDCNVLSVELWGWGEERHLWHVLSAFPGCAVFRNPGCWVFERQSAWAPTDCQE